MAEVRDTESGVLLGWMPVPDNTKVPFINIGTMGQSSSDETNKYKYVTLHNTTMTWGINQESPKKILTYHCSHDDFKKLEGAK